MEALIILLSILAGATSYLVVNFWMNPLLRYLEIKHQVTSDLVFYANVIDATGLNEEMQERRLERQRNNRRHAAEIRATYYRLPSWYRARLRRVGEDPIEASRALIGLSNSSHALPGDPFVTSLANALRIPDEIRE
jgi:hypothetical protein